MDRWAESVHAASSFLCEYRIVRPDGSVASVRETTDPVRNVDGDVVCWQGVTHDITDRQAAEEALTRSETRYRALVERLPAVVYVDSDEVDPRSLYVSPNSEEVLGYAPSRYLEDPGLWYATIHPDDLTMVQAGVGRRDREPRSLHPRVPHGATRRWLAVGPRQFDPDHGRSGRHPLLAGRHARHHRPEAGRGGPPPVRDPLSRVGRTGAGHRLHLHRRGAAAHAVHEPPFPRPGRGRLRGGRAGHPMDLHDPRGPARGGDRRVGRGRAHRFRLRPRVPQDASRRGGDHVGPRHLPPGAGRGRATDVPPGRDLGHHAREEGRARPS